MAKRMTYEEKEAARAAREEAARIAERTKQIDEFKQRRDKERALKIYSDDAAWKLAPPDQSNVADWMQRADYRSANALWELVRQFRSLRDDMRRYMRRLTERADEVTRRLDDGRNGSGYSTVLGDTPAEIEQCNAKIETVAHAIASVAYVSGWYVAEIYSKRYQEWRARLVGIDVVGDYNGATDGRQYLVRSTQDDGGVFYLAMIDGAPALDVDSDRAVAYSTEDDAYMAALTFVGDGRWL